MAILCQILSAAEQYFRLSDSSWPAGIGRTIRGSIVGLPRNVQFA